MANTVTDQMKAVRVSVQACNAMRVCVCLCSCRVCGSCADFYTHMHTNTRLCNGRARTHLCTHTCACAYASACTHTHTCKQTYTQMGLASSSLLSACDAPIKTHMRVSNGLHQLSSDPQTHRSSCLWARCQRMLCTSGSWRPGGRTGSIWGAI